MASMATTQTALALETREPWQMTRQEEMALPIIARPLTEGWARFGRRVMYGVVDPHSLAVADAVAAGLPVPAVVLADYPSLRA